SIPSDRLGCLRISTTDEELVRRRANGARYHLAMVNDRGEVRRLSGDQGLMRDGLRDSQDEIVLHLRTHQPRLCMLKKRLGGRMANDVHGHLSRLGGSAGGAPAWRAQGRFAKCLPCTLATADRSGP